MNETIQQLFDRKSVRVFEEKEISAEDKELILTAAVQAPTAGNQQLYTILDITDQEMKEKLAITCDNQPFIAKAKMVLIFCADCRKWYDAYLEGGCVPRKPDAGDFLIHGSGNQPVAGLLIGQGLPSRGFNDPRDDFLNFHVALLIP